MEKSKGKPIDAAKLKKEILKHGKTAKISRELGYNSGYFTCVMQRGYIVPSAAQLLELKYGIKYDDYKPDPEPEQITYDFTRTKYDFDREITAADIVAELIAIRELLKTIARG